MLPAGVVDDRKADSGAVLAPGLVTGQPARGEVRWGRHRNAGKPLHVGVLDDRDEQRQVLGGERLEPDHAFVGNVMSTTT